MERLAEAGAEPFSGRAVAAATESGGTGHDGSTVASDGIGEAPCDESSFADPFRGEIAPSIRGCAPSSLSGSNNYFDFHNRERLVNSAIRDGWRG
jgi:hypothetical protein